jgi:hypothetical protein
MAVRLLMPTHLFPVKHAEARVVVALDPVFFEGPDGTFKIHKGKIAYLVAAATEYAAQTPSPPSTALSRTPRSSLTRPWTGSSRKNRK